MAAEFVEHLRDQTTIGHRNGNSKRRKKYSKIEQCWVRQADDAEKLPVFDCIFDNEN